MGGSMSPWYVLELLFSEKTQIANNAATTEEKKIAHIWNP